MFSNRDSYPSSQGSFLIFYFNEDFNESVTRAFERIRATKEKPLKFITLIWYSVALFIRWLTCHNKEELSWADLR